MEITTKQIGLALLIIIMLGGTIFYSGVFSFLYTRDVIQVIGIDIDNAVIEPNQTEMQVTYSILPHPDIDRKQRGQFLLFFYVDNKYVYTKFNEYSNNLIEEQVTIPIKNFESGQHKLKTEVMIFAPEWRDCGIKYIFSGCDEQEFMNSCGDCKDRIEFYKRLPCEIRNEFYPLININMAGSYEGYRCFDINLLKTNFPLVDAADGVKYWKKWELNDTFFIKEDIEEIVDQKVLEIIEQQKESDYIPKEDINEDYDENKIMDSELVYEEESSIVKFLNQNLFYIILVILALGFLLYFSLKRRKK